MENTTPNGKGFIPLNGGYKNLIAYKKSEIIYDGTVYFTRRFFTKYDRTTDQMVQAARSGKQNIAEGSMASATSKETEIKLTNVARASLDELKLDYKDFLRTKNLTMWDRNHPLSLRFDALNKIKPATYEVFKKGIENPQPEVCANVMLCLTRTAIYLLNNQLKKLELAFVKEGGLRERMAKARRDERERK